ncbi:MAG: tetratricopeptide repeat protein [Deltaproteobacteria bacterium]|nr:tetratricopeptide repeat protein [Deltaproteobacteria bacterium]
MILKNIPACRVKSFPVVSDNQGLVAEDFIRFSRTFGQILLKKIPTAESVHFLFNEEDLGRFALTSEDRNGFLDLFHLLRNGGKPWGVFQDFLLILFKLSENKSVVAVCSNVDSLFNRRASDDWLSDVRLDAAGEFLLLKQARIDHQTGLFNLSNLYSVLDNLTAVQTVQLAVIQMSERNRSSQTAAGYLHKCVSSLQACTPDGSIIHYLGNYIFAVVGEFRGENDRANLTTSLVAGLKREGFSRIHIGSTYRSRIDGEDKEKPFSRQLLDEGWTALQEAVKRGPYGYADFLLLANPEMHVLVRPDKNLVRRLRRLWQHDEKFCLVHFRSDDVYCSAAEIVAPYISKGKAVISGKDLIIYFGGGERETILEWTGAVIGECKKVNPDKTVSAGISCFPYSDFKKSETVYNCLKALAHAAFFGNSGMACFDSVSLNISGDIYFSDGDLVKAVREYRRGLKCDESDVNLYNSLGVTFAMMGRFNEAEHSFKKALKLDSKNFMALYNLGLGELNNNRKKEAILLYKRALLCSSGADVDTPLLENELKRNIGVLAAETGDYQEALHYLLPWYHAHGASRQAERLAYHIGRSYYGLSKNAEAMEWLQRALQSNQYDDRAMHFLGLVYFEEGEGDEIAVSLCQKSVALDPHNHQYRLGLARMQISSGMFVEALGNLKQSIKRRELRSESQLYLAQCYAKIGHNKRAFNWFSKVDSREVVHRALYQDLKQFFQDNLQT